MVWFLQHHPNIEFNAKKMKNILRFQKKVLSLYCQTIKELGYEKHEI